MKDDVAAGVRTITLDREPMNTLDLDAAEWLCGRLASHPVDLPIVLQGTGGVFSAGVDAKRFVSYDQAQRVRMAQVITQMTAHLLSIPAPVLACIQGHALGGGFVLGLCCDDRMATQAEEVKFGLLEARAGIAFSSGPAHIVQHELSSPLRGQLTLSSRTISAAELLRHAVSDELAESDQLAGLAAQRIRQLAAQPGYRAVKLQMRGDLAARVRQPATEGREPAFE